MNINNTQFSSVSAGYSQDASKRVETTWHLLEELPRQYAAPPELLVSQPMEDLSSKELPDVRSFTTYKRDGAYNTFTSGTVIDRRA